MFGIGFPEMVVILVLIVLVVGPEQLPDVLRKGVTFIREARRHLSEIKSEVDKQTQPLRKPIEDMVQKAEKESLAMEQAASQAEPHGADAQSFQKEGVHKEDKG